MYDRLDEIAVYSEEGIDSLHEAYCASIDTFETFMVATCAPNKLQNLSTYPEPLSQFNLPKVLGILALAPTRSQ